MATRTGVSNIFHFSETPEAGHTKCLHLYSLLAKAAARLEGNHYKSKAGQISHTL